MPCAWRALKAWQPLLAAARRGVGRFHRRPPHTCRGEAPRPLEKRQKPQQVRQGDPLAQAVGPHPARRVGVRPAGGGAARGGAPRPAAAAGAAPVRKGHGLTAHRVGCDARSPPHPQKRGGGDTFTIDGPKVSDDVLRASLRKAFGKALAEAKGSRLFLELFAGEGVLTCKLKAAGAAAIALDIKNGPSHDLLNPVVVEVISGWIKGGCIRGLWFSTPCTSWS